MTRLPVTQVDSTILPVSFFDQTPGLVHWNRDFNAASQRSLGDFNAALDSKQHALDIRRKLFRKEHACTAVII